MKLNDKFMVHEDGDTKFVVSTGNTDFKGIARGNESAGFIIDCLRSDTTEDEIVDAMCARYDAPREVIAADVSRILSTLRSIRALEE